jgi:hypothetical protein
MNPNAKTDVSGDGDAYDEDRRFPTTVARSTPTKQVDDRQEDIRVDDNFDNAIKQSDAAIDDSPMQNMSTSVRDDADAVKIAVSGFGDEIATNPDVASVPDGTPAKQEISETTPESQPAIVPMQPIDAPKSKKKLYLIVGGVVALIVVAIIGYATYAGMNSSADESAGTPAAVSTPTESKNKATEATAVTPDTALDDLTSGIASEATAANADDTAAATDAAAAAAAAGSGIDESNF